MTKLPYHSALANGKMEDADPLPAGVVHLDQHGNVVTVWDINADPIPEAFLECDLIYCEPAFPAGMSKFDDRAGKEPYSYEEYATNFGRTLKELAKPTVMFIPERALKFTPAPDFTTEAMLNGNKTLVAFWNGAFSWGDDNHTIIRCLADNYDRVGDFCAGYGTTGRLFAEAGKGFVMSDYNAQCCGYIAANMEGWGA